MSKEDLCGIIDGLGLSRMKCYAMNDSTWDQLRNYFFLICKSTEDYEIWDSSESACSIPHMLVSEPEVESEVQSVQECTVDVASDLSLESPVLE